MKPVSCSTVLSASRRSILAFSLLCLLGGEAGCGSQQSTGPTGQARVLQRMNGTWRVQTFVPEDRLEAPLQSLLNLELGQLTITFSADTYRAQGPGVDVGGRFRLETGEGDLLTGFLYDSTGVAYRISAAFENGVLNFRSYDSPWRGTGTLLRLGN